MEDGIKLESANVGIDEIVLNLHTYPSPSVGEKQDVTMKEDDTSVSVFNWHL